jgi:hypothetical protein
MFSLLVQGYLRFLRFPARLVKPRELPIGDYQLPIEIVILGTRLIDNQQLAIGNRE